MDHTNCSFAFQFQKPCHDNVRGIFDKLLMPFSCTRSLLITGVFLCIPFTLISAHANRLPMQNSAENCVGLFKDFDNIPNSK